MTKIIRFLRHESKGEERGQSLVEMAVITPFLLILLLAIFEMSQAYRAYIALVNAAREGAAYASLYPELSDSTKTPSTSQEYLDYLDRVKGEADAAGLDMTFLSIDRPVAPQIKLNCPITETLHYQLYTFSSQMSMPYFGRMGLPDHYQINYSVGMPIRTAGTFCP
jgi:hypothetical protein